METKRVEGGQVAAVRTATRLLQAKIVKDQWKKANCKCRVLIGDNKNCKVHN